MIELLKAGKEIQKELGCSTTPKERKQRIYEKIALKKKKKKTSEKWVFFLFFKSKRFYNFKGFTKSYIRFFLK